MKERKEKQEADKKHREEVAAKKKDIRKNAQSDIDELRKKTAAEMKKLDEQIKKAKEQLRDAIDKECEAYDRYDAISSGGVYNPNGAQIGGRLRPRTGAAANNTDNGGWGTFAKPEGWDARWA